MTTSVTTGWRSGNAIAASGSVTPWSSQTSARRRAALQRLRFGRGVIEERLRAGARLGEQPGVEDRGGEDGHAALLARRQQGVERGLVEQRVAGGEHDDVGVRLPHQRRQLGRVEHPRADRAHHALRAQLRERRVAVAERGVEVRLGVVEEERVEAVDAHAVERLLDAAADAVAREVPHAAVRRGDRKGRVVVHPAARVLRDEQPPDLGRERVGVPRLLRQERSHQALRLPEPVVRRGVEGADPGIPRRAQRLRGRGVVQWLEQATERAAAEAEPPHEAASSRVSSPRVSPTRPRTLRTASSVPAT